MSDFAALFGLIFAAIVVLCILTRQGIAFSGFIVIAVLSAMIAAGLLHFGLVLG